MLKKKRKEISCLCLCIMGLLLFHGHMTVAFWNFFGAQAAYLFPIGAYEEEKARQRYPLQVESYFDYDTVLIQQAKEKQKADSKHKKASDTKTQKESEKQEVDLSFSMDRLNDVDYLLQKCYRVDSTTTIDRSQLNAAEMIAQDMRLKPNVDGPQVLIYHTHASEAFEGNPEQIGTVVDAANVLTELLEEKYHMQVLHDTSVFDEDRDRAYSLAAPALEKQLADNPTIEVVIDLHRDGIDPHTHLVTEIDGKPTAQIMFFNGLSRSTAGPISYLPNENLGTNLAFSLQMQLAACQYYPDFSRCIYLKGYRYNMQYCPKTLLVEVGAQTNTLEEAINAMQPLADILSKVLQGKD